MDIADFYRSLHNISENDVVLETFLSGLALQVWGARGYDYHALPACSWRWCTVEWAQYEIQHSALEILLPWRLV